MTRSIATALLLMGAAILWLHLVHVVAGHRWFAVYGPVLGLALAVGGALVAVPAHSVTPPDSTRWRRAAAAATLLVLLVLPEWLEAELASGHGLDADTIADHGWSTVAALGTAMVLATVLEARRILRVLGL